MQATYTGHVEPGGAAATRDLTDLTVTKVSVGAHDNNAYLLVCKETDEALLIDAAFDPRRLSDVIGSADNRPQLKTILTTHQHWDHWQALGATSGAFGTNTIAHPLDAGALPVPPDFLVEHGDVIKVGNVPLEIIHLRGHTPGSICVLYRDPKGTAHLFTGDSLFPGGVGKTQSPADFTSLIDDVTERVFGQLADDTWFYPGHGDDSTLGSERPKLAEWRARGW
jgi:glyoxylase-like metal-dependent hydrolase (beta-lactamase superfamily II)